MAEAGGPIEILASEQAAVAAITAAALPRRFARLDRILALATEIPAAVLVSVEILVLLAGVVSRYVFNRPLTWTDELASALFLWLAMLGAVVAFRRGEHMRLTAIVGFASPAWRARWEVLAAIGIGAVLMMMIALIRLCQHANLRQVAGGLAVVLAVGAALWLAKPLLVG